MREAFDLNKQFVFAMALLVAVLLACVPLARSWDEHLDQSRRLYQDREQMAEAQYAANLRGAKPEALTVSSGESVTIGDTTFSPSPGNWVEVKPRDGGYCVQAGSEDQDTGWRCWENDQNPVVSLGVIP